MILADMQGELRPDIDLSFLFDQDEFNRAIKLRKELNISEQKG